ncbi:MAG TPA: bifunctional demethylmenaquinone methyltransferase/2-methoxy-6-polyprenyl-1,4-benzoquinol methylase UbiE [Flavobacteriales bacterium]|nr:bifunctional demethylmenaquinone methyltransferase/2-methoxy-6-polyprenyl-1,4-benzoquinol methylase UbiE [Flavobacteriales bacterium]HCA84012.1 bifunctional demethylmenaquinone methyltransferase/2-methoxy-6-polyprenyl-1,4-benzoquinol methylase UbiE [Flavobacteriales bacterium]HRE75503.1 bifunctional demethylmenaquinone methyltransferase/2-methoxy-6-polyprenyl-1,4-benzoquinol methylase UbiE [Flavobacteriales bacterium]HRJ35375.1 bifunctional demethylmenaquinone methyltransferase/2-methoxy-6-po
MGTPVKPYNQDDSKKQQVAQMFNNISHRYDFLNHFLSMGIDHIWRRKAIGILRKESPKHILDIATGTGDFAIAALKLHPEKVTGIDISVGMLEKGREKMKKRGYDNRVEMLEGDSENLPFADASFDAITVGFGVRNFENLEKGLGEMLRVLRPGKTAVILEFSKPRRFPVKQSFNFYSRRVIPFIGRTISKDKAAYTYLPESVEAFPEGKDFLRILEKVGYTDVKAKTVSGGIATIYTGHKSR